MTIRSMTGYAQVTHQSGAATYTLSLKSVNHRFLDLQLRMPSNHGTLEQKIRQIFKQRMNRGHVEMTLVIARTGVISIKVNQELAAGYVEAFRRTAAELGLEAQQPDLNAIFRLNGVVDDSAAPLDEPELEATVCTLLEQGIEKLNEMRALEGRGLADELCTRMRAIETATAEIEQLRSVISPAFFQKVRTRLDELIGSQADPDRILQEAALLAERSDIQEEIVRMKSHVEHFTGLLTQGGEVGKKLDFLLQEMNREANTMLSKISGVAGEALRLTELGLALKAEIEKSREQVQNLE